MGKALQLPEPGRLQWLFRNLQKQGIKLCAINYLVKKLDNLHPGPKQNSPSLIYAIIVIIAATDQTRGNKPDEGLKESIIPGKKVRLRR